MDRIIVGGEGELSSKIAIVGEALGEDEERFMRPFVGPTGQLLDKLLGAAGIVRGECYITNVIKERPPDNKIDYFIVPHKNETQDYKDYVEILHDELEKSAANVIIALGNTALYALTGKTGVTKWRGSILQSTLLPDRKILASVHPSSALPFRNYLNQRLLIMDLVKALKESEFPEIRYKEREIILEPTHTRAMEYLYSIDNLDLVAFDIEIVNEELSCISFAESDIKGISIPLYSAGGDYFPPDQELEVMKKIGSILEDTKIRKLTQNGMFDSTFLFRRYGIKTRPIDDTMVAQGIIYPDYRKSLEFITSIYTDEPYYKEEGKRRIKTGGGTDRDFWWYNAMDSLILMEVFPRMIRDLRRTGNWDTYLRQVGLIEPLLYIAERGIKVDKQGLADMKLQAEEDLIGLEEELNNMVGYPINAKSPKQLKAYFYIEKGIHPYRSRKGGGITTDDTAMKRIATKGYKEAELVLSIRKLTKMKSTYYDLKYDMDGRIRSNYNPIGTMNGRLSSSKTIFGTGTNMENQPHSMYKYFLADDNYLVYRIDSEQAENRIVAYVAGEDAMMAAFEEGRDIHKQTASLVFNKPIDEISDVDGSCPLGNGEQSERFWGKTLDHALNYGMGAGKFSLEYLIPQGESKIIIEKYHSIYPGIRLYHQWIRDELSKDRRLINCFSRRRVFMGLWEDDMFKKAYNFIPQSTVADLLNKTLKYIYYYSDEQFKYLEILNQVHDDIWYQVPISIGWTEHAKYLMKIKNSLEQKINWRGREFSIPTEVSVGFNFGDSVKVTMPPEIHQLAVNLEAAYNELRRRATRMV